MIRLYRLLLRLYPAAFRQQFADEMLSVFMSGLREVRQHRRAALVIFWLRELSSLPLQAAQEHTLAHQARERIALLEFAMSNNNNGLANFIYRFFSIGLLALVVAFCTLIILPFFAFGLDREPASYVAGGSYDPKGFPFFQTMVGSWARLAGMCTLALAPFAISFLGIVFVVVALPRWRLWSSERRTMALIAIAASVLLILFIVSDLGRTVVRWYAD